MNIEEYRKLIHKLEVNSKKYTKPIRIYCDVDGVILPFKASQEDIDKIDGRAKIEYIKPNYSYDRVEEKIGEIGFNKNIVKKLADLSKNPLIDFVWLTSWRDNAPYVLDKVLNIDSVGFLPWQLKFSDYHQVFKGSALRQDQYYNPSYFIWIDDLANIYDVEDSFTNFEVDQDYDSKNYNSDDDYIEIFHTIPQDNYLNVITDSYSGLTIKDILNIENWINSKKEILKIK